MLRKKVYFNLRKSSRERMWDTAREAARVCEPLVPDIVQQSSLVRLASYKQGRNMVLRKLFRSVRRFLPLLNYQSVATQADEADMLYMWGAFPKNCRKPFVVELDNPFVLSYYDQKAFHRRIEKIRNNLRRAQVITYLSKTARNHTLELIGQEFAGKSVASPPFMDRNYKKNRRPNDGMVRFLFVGLGFRRKGGPELLHAFSRLPHQNARLTVVSPVSDEVKAAHISDSRITFLPPQPRKVLFDELYPASDVFVFPSMLETLGVVILEALSYGMGIITTNLYATPEMVHDGINGKLLPHPFLKPTVFNGVPIVDCITPSRKIFTEQYFRNDQFYDALSRNVLLALTEAMENIGMWQKHSEALFEDQFAPEEWEHRLRDIITRATAENYEN